MLAWASPCKSAMLGAVELAAAAASLTERRRSESDSHLCLG